jgi:PKD repeat protein
MATFTFTQVEVVEVTLTVRDALGNTATETFQVRVTATPTDTTPPAIVLAATSVTGRVGEQVAFAATATDNGSSVTNASAFQWSFTEGGSPVTLTGATATHTFEHAGTYNVTLRVTDGAGNVGTAHMTVVVEPRDSTPATGAGIDPMLIVGVLAAVAALAGVGFMLTRKRGSPPDDVPKAPQEPTRPGGKDDSLPRVTDEDGPQGEDDPLAELGDDEGTEP